MTITTLSDPCSDGILRGYTIQYTIQFAKRLSTKSILYLTKTEQNVHTTCSLNIFSGMKPSCYRKIQHH